MLHERLAGVGHKLHKWWNRIILILALIAAFVAVWDQSVNGRESVIQASRGRCLVSSRTTALLANVLRRDQELFAELGGLSILRPSVRHDLTQTASDDNLLLFAVDRTLDPRTALPVLNGVGKRYVLSLHKRAYSCARALPDASPFQFGALAQGR